MESKRGSSPSRVSSKKKTRRLLTLGTKMEILQRLSSGETASSLGRFYNVNESSIRSIRRNSEFLKRSVMNSSDLSLKTTARMRHPLMEKMEKMLSIWIEDKNQQSFPLNSNIIRKKALKIYNYLKEQEQHPNNATEDFQASKGWFEKFKKRQSLHNVRFTGEDVSVDHEAAAAFPEQLKEIILAGEYSPQQVFNMSETGLFWKRLPSKTFISVEEKRAPGFKAERDRLTVMLCGNASGDFQSKPLLVYHSKCPRALRGLSLHTLPVYWRSNKKAWVTTSITEDWLMNCFSHEIEQYFQSHNLPFKALLILDNAPGHPSHLCDLHPNIRVVILPPYTASILQPLDQGLISDFKRKYLKHTLKRLTESIIEPDKNSVRDFWKRYNIRHAIENIHTSWDSISFTTMNGIWKHLWRECVHDFEWSEDENKDVVELIKLGRDAGFDDWDEGDIKELIESHCEELHEDELAQIVEEQQKEDVHNDCSETVEQKELTLNNLSNLLEKSDQLIQFAMDIDPNMERSLKIKRKITDAVAVYQEIYKQKKQTKQLQMTQFCKIASVSTIVSSNSDCDLSPGVLTPSLEWGETDNPASTSC